MAHYPENLLNRGFKMKNKIKTGVVLASIAAGVLAASLATAGVSDVTNTMHNFGIGGGSGAYQSTQINEVCIFCHTPHNAGKSQLLWNKANMIGVNAPTYRLYTSSKSLSSTVRNASTFSSNSPSLLCLGCHDGKTAMNVLHSSSTGVAAGTDYPAGAKLIATAQGGGGTTPVTMPWALPDMYGGVLPNMNLGGTASNNQQGDDLTNDHPLGFDYNAAQLEKPTALYALAQVGVRSTNKIKFFGASNKLECTTCHDPHVDTTVNPELKPFLVMSNSGSALCLSCHNK